MSQRILVGTADIARNTTNLTIGFRALGYDAESLVYVRSRLYDDVEYTHTGTDFLEGTTYDLNEAGEVVADPPKSFYTFADRYDVFVFISGSTLLPRMTDLPILKKMGKTIISRHSGTEVRDYELAKKFWSDYGRFYPYYKTDVETPIIPCSTEADLLGLSRYQPALANKMNNVRMSELYCDAILSGPPSHTLSLRPYFQSGPAIDVGQIRYKVPAREVPVILHAPSSPLYKQTDTILSGLKELEEEGVRFELRLLQEVPNTVVCREITEADIIIDELSCGSGLLAFEGMAGGCAVLGGHDGVSSPMPRNRPVLNITKDNFKEAVRRVVLDIRFRKELAELGREYIDSNISSPQSVAAYSLESVARDRENRCDLYPHLFSENAIIPDGELMPEFLKQRTLQVMQQYGVHPSANLERLMHEGLLPKSTQTASIATWNIDHLVQEGPWVLMHPDAQFGSPHPVPTI